MRVSVPHGELKWGIPGNVSHFRRSQRIAGAIENVDAAANASLFLKEDEVAREVWLVRHKMICLTSEPEHE